MVDSNNIDDVSSLSDTELSGLYETAYLLRSPENARRLLTALNRALSRTGKSQSLEELKRELGFDEEL